MSSNQYDIIVVGGGHAGAEAAWAAANLGARTALITMDRSKIGTMSCNPAIGGLAKGQMVREIDALGGLMARCIDATGIQFRVLNSSKGAAVRGPRAQADKYRYAQEVQRLLGTRQQISIVQGHVRGVVVKGGQVVGVDIQRAVGGPVEMISGSAVVLTTGTFMRGLMHTGEQQTQGGRVGEVSANRISSSLRGLGFELGRLKTGTPPRLDGQTIDFSRLAVQEGDPDPTPFSDLTDLKQFPVVEQRPCHITHTNEQIHRVIRENLHLAPMYNGQITTAGPRYCPSIEDKVVRFADRPSHHVYLEPESLDSHEVYCNGISTSLPAQVQDEIVARMPGCENAKILRYGYAVEYDMVWPHQIDATCMTKRVAGLFLAGQINGTSGYEEAAGQGLIAGINAVRYGQGQSLVRLRRDQAYIGVMLDDLVTKKPREPYRMFTSRAEFRLLLRADNTADRLTPLGRELGVVDDERWGVYQQMQEAQTALVDYLGAHQYEGETLLAYLRRPTVDRRWVLSKLNGDPLPSAARDARLIAKVVADVQYAGYIRRQEQDVRNLVKQEQAVLPHWLEYDRVVGLRKEAADVLSQFRPVTLGQAGRLAGVTPADLMLVSVAMKR